MPAKKSAGIESNEISRQTNEPAKKSAGIESNEISRQTNEIKSIDSTSSAILGKL
jgi:hypothetical protein